MNNTGRIPGVIKAVSQDSPHQSDLPEGTVVSALPAQLIFAQYVQNGRVVSGLAIHTADGAVYIDPQGGPYTAALRPANDRFKTTLSDVLERAFPSSPADVPETDVVDVVATQMAGQG